MQLPELRKALVRPTGYGLGPVAGAESSKPRQACVRSSRGVEDSATATNITLKWPHTIKTPLSGTGLRQ
jgi:hypothetical protein